MKKYSMFLIVFVLVSIIISGCSKEDNQNAVDNFSKSVTENTDKVPKLLSEEGVSPYDLSESETYLLQSLGLENDTNIISFKAPRTAKSIKVNVYVLNDNSTWDVTGRGQVSIGQDTNSDDRLEGTFAMMLKDNYVIDFNINTMGRASYQTDILYVDNNFEVSAKAFLQDFQKIEINKEIPVAIMIYDSGNIMRSYTMDDFFLPSKFEEMDLVQAVTLVFTDETN